MMINAKATLNGVHGYQVWLFICADMAESADAVDLKSTGRRAVRVQVPLSAPIYASISRNR